METFADALKYALDLDLKGKHDKNTTAKQSTNKFDHLFEQPREITSLSTVANVSDLKENSLVRFRCMVRDMLDPEYFLASYQDAETHQTYSAKYQDYLSVSSDVKIDESKNVYESRMPIVCIPIPGESSWVTDEKESKAKLMSDFGAIVKIYDSNAETVKLCDTIDVIGLYSHPSTEQDQDHELALGESSKLPVIHCLAYRKIVKQKKAETTKKDVTKDMKKIRASLVDFVASVVGSSELAEVILLHLISRVHNRVNGAAIGSFSLNLTNLKPESVQEVVSLYQTLFPRNALLSITLDKLNKELLYPVKNYDTNELSKAALQLPKETTLLIDETSIKPGQLNEIGTKNTAALAKLISHQQLHYDFVYHASLFEADMPVLLLSSTKSIFPHHASIKVNAVEGKQNKGEVDTQLLNEWRQYISLARDISFEFTDSLRQVMEEDLVKLRKERAKITQDQLSFLLTLARLVGTSHLEESSSSETWEHAKKLFREVLHA